MNRDNPAAIFPAAIFAPPRARCELTLRRGERTMRLSLPSWALGVAAASLATLVLLSAGSTALFLMSDDIAAAFRTRESQTVAAYERRIADLRREVDRATSREMSDRQIVADKVGRMLDRQRRIDERFLRMEPLMDQARSTGLVPSQVPLPTERPDERASLDAPLAAYAAETRRSDVFAGFDLRRGASRPQAPAIPSRALARTMAPAASVSGVEQRIDTIEAAQIAHLSRLAEAAEERASEFAQILTEAGFADGVSAFGVGGPFVPVPILDPFANEMERLSGALDDLRSMRGEVQSLPLGAPMTGTAASSNFGVRLDPFLRRPALHAGIDYPAPTGTAVQATASGEVVHASRNGGYGLMVEIDHGGGYVTRYAHLSGIDVRVGERVEAGARIGRVGSTGRSTGPHLHYEVHRAGQARDPARYLAVGQRLERLL